MNPWGIFFSFIIFSLRISAQSESIVFQSGSEGYDTFRIPAIIQNSDGTLLAFSEGRVNSSSDFGNVDIVLKTSNNQGKTWSDLKILVDNDSLQAGNCTPVLDLFDPNYPNGRIILFYNTGNTSEHSIKQGKGLREAWFISSVDGGRSWSSPENITSQVHLPNYPLKNYQNKEDWRWYANAPGHALQMRFGKYKGRIIVPANHSFGAPQTHHQDYRAHIFYSDDHGKSFHLGETISLPGSNEAIAAQGKSGELILNMRDQSGLSKRRFVALSSTGGESWDSQLIDSTLIDPVCQGSILNFFNKKGKIQYIIFSNNRSENRRDNLGIYIDKKWVLVDKAPNEELSKKSWTAYSDLVQIDFKTIGILYEKENYSKIVFKLIPID